MAEGTGTWNESAAVDARVEELLQQLTLDEKIDLVSGKLVVAEDGRGNCAPSPISPFSLSDGPAGIRIARTAVTALPAPIALAATWDPDLARQYGDVIGAEAIANGHNILLGPAVDIARAPLAGRNFESLGEDPLLQSRLVVAELQAIQARPVQACLKHYIVNNQEYQRREIDVRVDERALREIYLPPFAAAVQQAHAAAVMGSYNKINGTYACENAHTLTAILREQLGFRGWVMSDFMANQSTAESANAGLDWELTMAALWGQRLSEAVQAGLVQAETIDEMVRRILRPTVGLGLLDQPRTTSAAPARQHGEWARAIAEQSIVLLKNAGDLLPLASDDLRSIAVIGPDADNVSAAGGGSALVPPAYGVSVLEGIRRRVGEAVRVEYASGTDPIGAGVLLPGPPAVSSTFLTPSGAADDERGLRAEYWANPDFEGEPSLVRIEPRAELNRGFFDVLPRMNAASPKLPSTPPELPARISIRWTGSLSVPATNDYTLALTSLGTARLFVDDRLLIDIAARAPSSEPSEPRLGSGPGSSMAGSAVKVQTEVAHLVAGERYAVRIEYVADAPEQTFFKEAMLRFGWQPPDEVLAPSMATAAELGRQSDVAIVVARTFESEEMDRPNLRLPNEQDVLIRAVAAANPRTIVVLMTGGPVETASWEAGAAAVIEAWYGGQEQGNAVARVLFGDVNPAGKLPLTFPRGEDQTPVATPAQYPGIDGAVHYSEGLSVGYRGYDQLGIEPQYPFGYGLSYTTFAYSELQVSPETADGTQPVTVSFAVMNTGRRAGTEVAQVYLGLPEAAASPPNRLVDWVRVALEAGERRQVSITLDPRSLEHPLSYWEAGANGWEIANGAYQVYVGASSRDLRLTGAFRIDQAGRM